MPPSKSRSTNALLQLPSLIKRPEPPSPLSNSPHYRNTKIIESYLRNVKNHAKKTYIRFQHNNAILKKKKPKFKISMNPQ